MLYLSIALIAAGVLFILYSLLSSKKTSPARPAGETAEARFPADEDVRDSREIRPAAERERIEMPDERRERHPADDLRAERERRDRESVGRALPEDRSLEKISDGSGEGDLPGDVATVSPVTEERGAVDQGNDKKADEPVAGMEHYAVLYEDASNIIDYYSGENTIDPSLAAYAKIKRVGRGSIEQARDGINFFFGKKFYRFDFYRVTDIRAGGGYLALSMKDSATIRLFIFESESPLASEIAVRYNEYMKGKL